MFSSRVLLDKKVRVQGKEADFRMSWLHQSLPVVPCSMSGIPGANKPLGMSQRGLQCGCGSPHMAWLSWERKAPLGKETSTQMEKKPNRLRENSRLQNNISKSKCGDPHIRETKGIVRASSCWPRKSRPAHLFLGTKQDSQRNSPSEVW